MVSRVAEVFFWRGFEARRHTGLAGESRPGELMPFFPFLSAFAAISASPCVPYWLHSAPDSSSSGTKTSSSAPLFAEPTSMTRFEPGVAGGSPSSISDPLLARARIAFFPRMASPPFGEFWGDPPSDEAARMAASALGLGFW